MLFVNKDKVNVEGKREALRSEWAILTETLIKNEVLEKRLVIPLTMEVIHLAGLSEAEKKLYIEESTKQMDEGTFELKTFEELYEE